MKASRIEILGTLAMGALLGYIVACSNTKPAASADAAPTKSETVSRVAQVAKPVQLAQASTTAALAAVSTVVGADGKKPNILIIWGNDVGYWNLSCINNGMMG